MEVEIISREIIKPSSPTPQHLKIFKLSLLDQLIISPYAPIILFYPENDIFFATKRLHILKVSLSETLTSFYPLAGRIEDDLTIHCNDQGVDFLEGRVNCTLHEFLSKPDLLLLNKFLPFGSTIEGYVSNIQVSTFNCGGIALGLCISHKILDGDSLSTFLKVWSSISNDITLKKISTQMIIENKNPNFMVSNSILVKNTDTQMVIDSTNPNFIVKNDILVKNMVTHLLIENKNPNFIVKNDILVKNMDTHVITKNKKLNFIAKSVFPTNDLWLRDLSIPMWSSLFKKGKCVTRRFVFSASSIAILKSQATSTTRPTRVEVVSAFIWKCVTLAKKNTRSFMTHLVNLRKRMSPPLMENSIGNFLWVVAAQSTSIEPKLKNLVGEMRQAISRIDGEFVKKLNGENGKSLISKSLSEVGELGSMEGTQYVAFTSWCKFGFYETDFGWGKPLWVSSMVLEGCVFLNLVVLVDTRVGDGIEAWVCLDEEEMNILVQEEHELLKYATLDPNPIL